MFSSIVALIMTLGLVAIPAQDAPFPAELKLPVLGQPLRGAKTAPLYLPSAHTAYLLPDGRVLIDGGQTRDPGDPTSIVFDPKGGAWVATGSKDIVRGKYAASLLPDGRILVSGGQGQGRGAAPAGSLSTTEIYDPVTGKWKAAAPMANPRVYHTATLLRTGKVLVAGGARRNRGGPSAELYNPVVDAWAPTGEMKGASVRYDHTATLLADGRVLVAGGLQSTETLGSAEVFDPATGTWTVTGSMKESRLMHAAILLTNGQVLVVGGTRSGGIGAIITAELYDPVTGQWKETGAVKQMGQFVAATLLQDGKVLAVSGGRAELYDPAVRAWSPGGVLTATLTFPTATMLADGKVLVVGRGSGPVGNSAGRVAEIYDPAANKWSSMPINVVMGGKL